MKVKPTQEDFTKPNPKFKLKVKANLVPELLLRINKSSFFKLKFKLKALLGN